jgi:hypothetical protein
MDPQILSVIATTAIGFLSSYLTKAGESAATKVGEDIYQRLKARFGNKPVPQNALVDLVHVPTDPDRQAALRVQLKKLLAEDVSFAAQLQDILKEAGKTQAGATIIQQVAGDNAKQFGQVFGNVTFDRD